MFVKEYFCGITKPIYYAYAKIFYAMSRIRTFPVPRATYANYIFRVKLVMQTRRPACIADPQHFSIPLLYVHLVEKFGDLNSVKFLGILKLRKTDPGMTSEKDKKFRVGPRSQAITPGRVWGVAPSEKSGD
jgi:hypothetical protein